MNRNKWTARLLSASLALTACAAPLAVRADDAKPPTPGKPETPPKPDTPRPPGRGNPGNRGGGQGNFDPTARLQGVVDELKLEGETKKKVDEFLVSAKADIAKAMADGGDDRRAKIGEITKLAAEQIASVLDEDQKLLLQSKLKAAANATPPAGGPGAGPGGNPGGRPQPIGDRLKGATAQLNLTEDQIKKVDALIADVQKKNEALRAAGGGPEMREKFQALRDDTLKQMQAILTPEQLQKYRELVQPQQPGQGNPGGGNRLGGALQRMQDTVKELTLTDDQKPKVDAAFATAKKTFDELAPKLQGGQPTPELREKLRKTFDDLRTELATILTPEQQEKLKAAMPQRPAGPKKE